jgi:hypothetical protein
MCKGNDYRYGFNGQEKVDEIAGVGNHNTALFWEYDTRLGRRWNLDPVPQINISDYAVNGLNPILYMDPNGDDKFKIHKEGRIQRIKTKDKFDQFLVYKDGDGDGDKEWVQVAQFNKNSHGLIAMPKKFRSEDFGWDYTGRNGENYISGSAMAGVIGTLRNSHLVISFNHWSNSDGSTPAPSKSHKNGIVGDVRPVRKDRSGGAVLVSDAQFDKVANTTLITNFKLFGWNSVLSERHKGWITPGTTHYNKTARHNNHYHLQKYKPQIELVTPAPPKPVETPAPTPKTN